MAQTSAITNTFDAMEMTVNKLFQSHPSITLDELFDFLSSAGDYKCILVERDWHLFRGGRKSTKFSRELVTKREFRVFAWSFSVIRQVPDKKIYIRVPEIMYVIVER